MNLLWLEDFLVLAASGNFSRAAELRHMTQPAFSRRVRSLEEWLGVTLFDRSRQPATLTEAGVWFRAVAQEILARVARVPDEARAVADASAATLRFAATHALSLTFLPAWLRGMESRTPIGPIQLISDVAENCEAMLADGRVQFLLCHVDRDMAPRLDAAHYIAQRVGGDRLIPVCAADDAGRARYTLDATRTAPLLAYTAESGLGRMVRHLQGSFPGAARLETVFTAHLATVLKSMALEGRGVAWLPHSLIVEELENGRLQEAGGTRWHIALDIALFRHNGHLPPAAERFWQTVIQL